MPSRSAGCCCGKCRRRVFDHPRHFERVRGEEVTAVEEMRLRPGDTLITIGQPAAGLRWKIEAKVSFDGEIPIESLAFLRIISQIDGDLITLQVSDAEESKIIISPNGDDDDRPDSSISRKGSTAISLTNDPFTKLTFCRAPFAWDGWKHGGPVEQDMDQPPAEKTVHYAKREIEVVGHGKVARNRYFWMNTDSQLVVSETLDVDDFELLDVLSGHGEVDHFIRRGEYDDGGRVGIQYVDPPGLDSDLLPDLIVENLIVEETTTWGEKTCKPCLPHVYTINRTNFLTDPKLDDSRLSNLMKEGDYEATGNVLFGSYSASEPNHSIASFPSFMGNIFRYEEPSANENLESKRIYYVLASIDILLPGTSSPQNFNNQTASWVTFPYRDERLYVFQVRAATTSSESMTYDPFHSNVTFGSEGKSIFEIVGSGLAHPYQDESSDLHKTMLLVDAFAEARGGYSRTAPPFIYQTSVAQNLFDNNLPPRISRPFDGRSYDLVASVRRPFDVRYYHPIDRMWSFEEFDQILRIEPDEDLVLGDWLGNQLGNFDDVERIND